MAILGFQICLTLIAATFLQKLSPILSLGRWILCSGALFRFLHPSNEELKKLSSSESTDKRSSKKDHKASAKRRKLSEKAVAQKSDTPVEVFKIPKNADVILTTANITAADASVLQKFDEFEWLVNYSLYAAAVFIITEIYNDVWKPEPKFNVSMVWCILALGFTCKSLFGIMRLYFKSNSGELMTSITFGCFSFVAAMGTLAVDEDVLEFGLGAAYDSFAKNSTLLSFNSVYPTPAPDPISLPVLKVCIALIGGVMATLLAFPGIRTAQMYVDGLKYAKKKPLLSLLLHINFGTPFVISMMWVRPIARAVLCSAYGDGATNREPFMTDSQFDINRIICIIVLCLLKLAAIRVHLQAYLNLAYMKLRRIRREAGNITNVDIQKTVAGVFFYLCIVGLQFLGPIISVLFMSFCLKSMGGHAWSQIWNDYNVNATHSTFEHPTLNVIDENSTFSEILSNANISLERVSAVFTPALFRSVFSFFIWWLCTVWFIASCIGIVYHRYLTDF